MALNTAGITTRGKKRKGGVKKNCKRVLQNCFKLLGVRGESLLFEAEKEGSDRLRGRDQVPGTRGNDPPEIIKRGGGEKKTSRESEGRAKQDEKTCTVL